MKSSGLNNISLAPSYFLICKRLENIGDNVNHVKEYMHKYRKQLKKRDIVNFLLTEIQRSMKYFMGKDKEEFTKIDPPKVSGIKKSIKTVEDKIIQNHLRDMLRYVINIEEEIVNISFYTKLFD